MFSKVDEGIKKGALEDIVISAGGLITAAISKSGYLKTGTKKTKQLTVQAAKTVTPGKTAQTAVASGRYTTGAVNVAAIPQEYVDLLKMTGYTNITIDKVTFSSEINLRNEKATIPHSLGVKPRVMILACDKKLVPTTKTYIPFMASVLTSNYFGTVNQNRGYIIYTAYDSSHSDSYGGALNFEVAMFYDNKIELFFERAFYIAAGVEYTLITMA